MAIRIDHGVDREYLSGTGVITEEDRRRADLLHGALKRELKRTETLLIKQGALGKDGKKTDALKVWYEIGRTLNKTAKEYGIAGTTDEPYYWNAIYNYVSSRIHSGAPPKRSQGQNRNHFRLCGVMAKFDWKTVEAVGPWATWRDIFDNAPILEDDRILNFVVYAVKKYPHHGHKAIRPFVHEVRRRLNRKDTSVLDDKELKQLFAGTTELLKAD